MHGSQAQKGKLLWLHDCQGKFHCCLILCFLLCIHWVNDTTIQHMTCNGQWPPMVVWKSEENSLFLCIPESDMGVWFPWSSSLSVSLILLRLLSLSLPLFCTKPNIFCGGGHITQLTVMYAEACLAMLTSSCPQGSSNTSSKIGCCSHVNNCFVLLIQSTVLHPHWDVISNGSLYFCFFSCLSWSTFAVAGYHQLIPNNSSI